MRYLLLFFGATGFGPPSRNNFLVMYLVLPSRFVGDLIDEVKHAALTKGYSSRGEEVCNCMRESCLLASPVTPVIFWHGLKREPKAGQLQAFGTLHCCRCLTVPSPG